ncbi:MAG: MFS transporter [Bdellovibrionales bacterium]|nr:MFS transporter [Bdellovibrionales bacterium]
MSDSAPQPPADSTEIDARLRRPFFTREGQLRDRLTPLQKKWIILVLTLVMFTHTMDFMVLMPLGPRLMVLFQISPQQFSFLVSIYSFTAGIFGFFGSLVFDRLDRKHALLGTYLGFLLGTLSCALAPSFPILLAARALSGAFGGLLAGIAFAIVGDLFSIHERGAATGKLMTSFSLAAIIGVPIGLVLSTNFGWHAPFFAIVGIGLIAIVTILKVIPNVRSHLQSHYSGIFSGLTENFTDPNSRRALMTTFMMVLSQFVVVPFISPYLVSNTGFPEADLPLVYLLGGALTAFSGPLVGRICDRSTPRKVFTRTGLLFLLPMFMITHLGFVPVPVALVATTAFFVLSNARMVPAMTIIQSSIPPSRRGGFMSLNSCIQQLGSASASFASGWVITQVPGTILIQGFSETAYLSILFGIFAYLFGRSIRMVS